MKPRAPKPVSAPRNGFTLIELLVVIVVLGILGATAALSADGTRDRELDVAEMQIRDAVARAALVARSSRQTAGVVFNLTSSRLAVVDETGTAVLDPLTKGPWIVSLDRLDQPGSLVIVSAEFGATGQAIVFDPQGTPLAGGSLSLRSGHSTRTLSVDGMTGLVSVP